MMVLNLFSADRLICWLRSAVTIYRLLMGSCSRHKCLHMCFIVGFRPLKVSMRKGGVSMKSFVLHWFCWCNEGRYYRLWPPATPVLCRYREAMEIQKTRHAFATIGNHPLRFGFGEA